MDEIKMYETESEESDKPPSSRPRPVKKWRVAIVANVKGGASLPTNGPEDAGAEFDKEETIDAIRAAIESRWSSHRIYSSGYQLTKQLERCRP